MSTRSPASERAAATAVVASETPAPVTVNQRECGATPDASPTARDDPIVIRPAER
jgi:hypothetical protein